MEKLMNAFWKIDENHWEMNDFTFQSGKKKQHPFVNVSFPVIFNPFKLFGWDRRCAPENGTQGWDKVGLAIRIAEVGRFIKKRI